MMLQTRERVGSHGNSDMPRKPIQPRNNYLGPPSKSPKFIVTHPIRGIFHNPLQVKVVVPRAGRSTEYQLSKAIQGPIEKAFEDSIRACSLKAACDNIYVSVQAQRADETCAAGMSAHTHFDLVLRMADAIRSAHLLCKVVYHNVRGDVKEMGPYMLTMFETVTSYRLEEMNCHVSEKTGHHHVYLLLQLVAAESAKAGEKRDEFNELRLQLPDIQRRPRSRVTSGGSLSSSAEDLLPASLPVSGVPPNQNQLPDFTSQWSPMATVKIVVTNGNEDRALYCVPQVLCLYSEEFEDLLVKRDHLQGELVLSNTSYSDLLLLLQLTYPGTPRTVNLNNVQQVLRIASHFRVTGLLKTAENLLCSTLASGCVKQSKRAELVSLAAKYNLQELKDRLNAVKTIG